METSFAQSVLQALTRTGGYPVLDEESGCDLRVWLFRERPATLSTSGRPDAFILYCEIMTEGTGWYVDRVAAGEVWGTEAGRWPALEDAVQWLAEHLAELPARDQFRDKHTEDI